MSDYYPLLFEPVLKYYLWGGRNFQKLGRELPENTEVAESWEIAAHKDGMSIVLNGKYKGQTLGDLFSELGECLVGFNNQWALDRGKFPLMVKLIDANQSLSVQVHPDDTYAMAHEGNELGKFEMWVIIDAEPGAEIIYGFREQIDKETFREAVEKGTLGKFLHHIPIKKGDHICVPSRTIHAILEGALIAEIQQNSNTTYRVFDWNRLGDDGKPRALHLEKALDVIDFAQVGASLPDVKISNAGDGWTAERLCENRYFTTERIRISNGGAYSGFCDGSTLEIWGVLSGSVKVNEIDLYPVTFVLMPAALGAFTVAARDDAVLLRTFVR
ncbi:MAG: type I phosphomannose isomerase catalytic subunit [Brevefilum sp.]|nr:class I mannose-6-phosphate isomerase [Brevefilum sp.]MDT8381489.1 type I phosphomannose isomerase catalytic subunit [Brevefilum sp.]